MSDKVAVSVQMTLLKGRIEQSTERAILQAESWARSSVRLLTWLRRNSLRRKCCLLLTARHAIPKGGCNWVRTPVRRLGCMLPLHALSGDNISRRWVSISRTANST